MKRYLTIFVLLCTIGTVHGANFVYHAGGFRAKYDVYAWNPPFFDGPWTLTQPSTNSASVSRVSIGVPQARFDVFNYIHSDISTNSIRIQSFSVAKAAADTGGGTSYAQAKGFTRTRNAQGYGIFYKIMPDANEQNGDDVMVYYNHTANISIANGTTSLRIGGSGTMDHIAITLGQLTPVAAEPPREKEVLSFPDVNVTNGGPTDWFSGIHAFPAQIGDVIGIFAENSTAVEGWGTMTGWIESTFSMVLSVEPVLLGDLDDDDDVDLFDLAKLANNWLVDIGFDPHPDTTPPEPNPMQWASLSDQPHETYNCRGNFYYCATMTAKTATDPSGGVQYYFECTDESAFSSGWQSSPSYSVPVATYSGQNFHFRVRARDIHDNRTDWSTTEGMIQ